MDVLRTRFTLPAPCRWALAVAIVAVFAAAPVNAASPRAAAPARLVFASYALGAAQGQKAVVLRRSIRAFGGACRQAPLLVVADEAAADLLEREGDQALRVLPVQLPTAARTVPLAAKAFAAAQIEREVARTADTMLWIDPESVVLSAPDGLILRRREAVALQPVFLTNRVGQSVDQPVDPYWASIYRLTGLAGPSVPHVETVVDGGRIRFYINCGVIALRPSRGMCTEWARALLALLEDAESRRVVLTDAPHALFLHQAVLSAVIAARTRPAERRWIPIAYGYPLGLHDRVPSGRRVARLNDVTCLIYDQVWDQDPDWLSRVAVDGALRTWLRDQSRAASRPPRAARMRDTKSSTACFTLLRTESPCTAGAPPARPPWCRSCTCTRTGAG
jgi:hypothetical protein